MPLIMNRATEEDVDGLAAILFEEYMEMHEWTRVRFHKMKPEDRLAYLTSCLREDLTNPEYPVVIQKVTDEDTGEIVAFLQLNDCNVPANNRSYVNEIEKPVYGYNKPPIRDYYAKMMAAQKQAMGSQPFMHIADLSTKKTYRRRGISSTLMRWGMDLATARNLPIYVEATPEGQFVYKKLGWQVMGSWKVDLEQYGGTGIYEELGMRWPPLEN